MRTLTALTNQPWAITADALRTMVAIATRENPTPEAVAAQLGRPLDNTRTVTVRDGVACIPVSGPIFRYANLFTEVSGATSIEVLAQDFARAVADPSIGAVLLVIDSPGGEVTGTHNLADMVYAARGQKPIWSYVEGLGASAAYWLASATDRIVCEATAALGSVGVVMAVPDPTQQKQRDIQFVSSQSPNKRPDPTTEAGRSRFQQLVDDTADVFVSAVARNRGMTVAQVVEDFDAGGVLTGQRAVDARLADAVGSFEGCIADLAQAIQDRQMASFRRPATFGARLQEIIRNEAH